jgi:dihydroneopterin aldolase
MPDCIRIESLELASRIGVTEEERAQPQRLTVSLVLEPTRDFRALGDQLENTVDYFVVCEWVKAVSLARPRRLVETLAEEIAAELLSIFRLRAVAVDLRKYILADTAYVAVQIRREASEPDTENHPDE